MVKGDIDGAIVDFTQAIRLAPNLAEAYFNRAAAWTAKGDNDDALADYDETIRLDARCAQAWAHRGLTQLQKGREAEAHRDFAEAARLNRDLKAWVDNEVRKTASERVSKR
jgi:tetratricopeptide (TPR) repeat protein